MATRKLLGLLLVAVCVGFSGLAGVIVADDSTENRDAIKAAEVARTNYLRAKNRDQNNVTKSYVEQLHDLSREMLTAELRLCKDREDYVIACSGYLRREGIQVGKDPKPSGR